MPLNDNLYRTFHKYNTLLVFIALGVFLYTKYELKKLPDPKQIISKMYQEPVQSPTIRQKFNFPYEGTEYVIEPVADYTISGMIVTHNNISSITDAYHTSKSVDIKDLCVIWGDNVKNTAFKGLKFWSEPWTCFYQGEDRNALEEFNGDQLSNNHLLGATPEVREVIKKAKIGDQVTFKGMLVNYYEKGYPEYKRKTSTIRTDTGQGACEVVYVEKITIDKEWQPTMSLVNKFSKYGLILLIILKILGFIIIPQIEYRRIHVGQMK